MNTELNSHTEMDPACKAKLGLLGDKLAYTDNLLVHLMARRLNLALKVAAAKHPTNQPTVRLEVEKRRLDEIAQRAEAEGANGEFSRALLYLIIGESCKVQTNYRDHLKPGQKLDYSLLSLRNNLLELTQGFAPKYDSQYAPAMSLKEAHAEFEHSILLELIEHLPSDARDLLVDIGCATGRETFMHVGGFERIIGYDVSPDMVGQAQANASLGSDRQTVEFVVQDVEKAIPLPNESVSCVYLNHGTASDIPDIKHVLLEIRRVLRPGGIFLLSFYNANALMYQSFLPWPPALGAEVDNDEHYVEVAFGGKVIPVYAKAYSPEEAESLLPPHLVLFQTVTHPTLGSVVPRDVFEGKPATMKNGVEKPTDTRALEAVKSLDITLSSGSLGAYVILTGKKV